MIPKLLLFGAALGASLPAQQADEEPHVNAITGWLEEILDGNPARAIQTYERAAQPRHDAVAREVALRRALKLARGSGDTESAKRLLAMVRPNQRTAAQQRQREQAPRSLAGLRQALNSANREALAKARGSFVRDARRNRSLDLWVPIWQAGSFDAAERRFDSTTPPGTLRLSLKLPTIGLPLPVRNRAADITALRVRGLTFQADRLETDVVSRLLGRGTRDALSARLSTDTDTDTVIAAGQRQLKLELARETLTSRERAALLAARDRTELLTSAERNEEAAQLLLSLPYVSIRGR